MNEETLASVLGDVVRLRSAREAKELSCAIEICDECGRAQAKGPRKAVGLAALKMYTFVQPCVYLELNAAMRNNDWAAIEPYGRYVRTMAEAMLVSPRFEGSTVYRGIPLDMRAVCTKGATLVWPEFASCTSSIETQETFLGTHGDRTLFVVTLTQGRARSIAEISMMPGESEVLLPPNTRVTVESAYRAGNGLLLVTAVEIQTECMLVALEVAEADRRAEEEADRRAEEEADRREADDRRAEAEADRMEAAAAVEADRRKADRRKADDRRKARRCPFIVACVLLARITRVVARATLIGAGTVIWLVVRLVSRVVRWLLPRGQETRGSGRSGRSGTDRREECEAERVPRWISLVILMGELASIIATAHLVIRLCEDLTGRPFLL